MLKIKTNGLEQAIKMLDQVPEKLDEKAVELVERLGDEGKAKASYHFAEAAYAGDKYDTRVNAVHKSGEKTSTVIAEGTAVLFIEFGTGITMPDAEEARGDIVAGSVLRHGQFGEKRGANPNGWVFPYENMPFSEDAPLGTHPIVFTNFKTGHRKIMWKTRGNPAYPAVYMSKLELMDESERIVREVFGK